MTNHRIPFDALPKARRDQILEWPLERKRYYSEKCLQPAAYNLRLSFVAINKSGVTTATVAIRQFHKLAAVNWQEHAELYPDHKIVANWRDPWKRCESTYRWAIGSYGDFMPGVMPDARSQPFRTWVEELCDVDTPNDWYDSHLQSQVWLASDPNGRMPDIILPWDWPRLWNMFKISRPGEIRNKSEYAPTEWSARSREAFERVYAEDIAVWEGLNHGN
jgi:hypothetical protein